MSQMRPPARSRSTSSLLWAIGFGFYIFLAGLALSWSRAAAFVISVVAGFGIFLFVRFYGEDEPRRP